VVHPLSSRYLPVPACIRQPTLERQQRALTSANEVKLYPRAEMRERCGLEPMEQKEEKYLFALKHESTPSRTGILHIDLAIRRRKVALGANTVGVGSWQRTDTCHDICHGIAFACAWNKEWPVKGRHVSYLSRHLSASATPD
jgi:hypothetical protein